MSAKWTGWLYRERGCELCNRWELAQCLCIIVWVSGGVRFLFSNRSTQTNTHTSVSEW